VNAGITGATEIAAEARWRLPLKRQRPSV
jgi:hypothetical protein